MRKCKAILSFLLILIFISSPGLAAKGNSRIIVSMDNKKHSVTEVPVLMDGQAVQSQVPSFIHKDYTFIPIRFISEQYGAKVEWDQKTKTATVIQEDKVIKMTINSKDVYINGEKKILDNKNIPKLVTFPNKDSRTMVPLRFVSETLGYEVGWDQANRVPFVNTSKDNGEVHEDIEEEHVATNNVQKIEKEQINGKEAIVIYNTAKPETKVMKLSNPERIVIDVLDSSLEGGSYFEYKYNLGFINGVRVSQFVPDNNYKPNDKIVRVVLDVKQGVADPNVKIDLHNNKIVIVPETSIWELINYSLEGANRIVSINANKETDYNVDYNSTGKSMTIDIPSENIDLKEGSISIKDGLINDIKIKEVGSTTKVTINFRRSVEYTILSRDRDEKITLSLKKDGNIKPSDIVIVIDAGHGGKDPGAVSSNGTREKDINISISQKLNKGLKNKGYTTIMTRDDDTFVNLYDRADIANNNQADIFISLHANSHPNKDIDGIQVLYNPNGKDIESYPLAKLIMDELLKGTEAKDKGIIKRPKLVVLNKTTMPAVLIEVGFLSNLAEEKLIIDEDYQEKIVDSIIKGVDKYFEMY